MRPPIARCADAGIHPQPLTPRQGTIFDLVDAYYRVTREPCPATIIARRLGVSYQAVRRNGFDALYRKGWLECPGSPATPRRFLARER